MHCVFSEGDDDYTRRGPLLASLLRGGTLGHPGQDARDSKEICSICMEVSRKREIASEREGLTITIPITCGPGQRGDLPPLWTRLLL